MTFGSQVGEPDAYRMLDYWLERGSNFLDTANVYNKGLSEEIIGRWLKGRPRDSVLLATKVRGTMGAGSLESGLSREAIFRQIDQSLERLQTDYVDFYYLHMPDRAVEVEESLEALEDLRRMGKIRQPAASNYAAWQMAEMQWIAARRGFLPVALTQPMYNLLARGIEQEFLPMCQRFGLQTAVYNPLAGGLLTGKQTPEGPQLATRFDGNSMYMDRYWHEPMFNAIERLRSIDRPLISTALNWLIHHSGADCIILGASRIQQLEQNLAACQDGPLPESALAICDEVWAALRGVTPRYNR